MERKTKTKTKNNHEGHEEKNIKGEKTKEQKVNHRGHREKNKITTGNTDEHRKNRKKIRGKGERKRTKK